jgi:predicted esterase YcpF (UPF0227 family)
LTFVYLHGFRSSPASAKGRRFAAAVAALPPDVRPALSIPELADRPARAMEVVDALVERGPAPVCVIGSSLGGFYATVAAERHGVRAVVINPAVKPDVDLGDHAGFQTNLHTGARFEVTPAHFDELRALRIARITRPERYFLLVQTGDEVLDYRQAVSFYAGAFQFVQGGGDHSFVGFDAQIPAILAFGGLRDG